MAYIDDEMFRCYARIMHRTRRMLEIETSYACTAVCRAVAKWRWETYCHQCLWNCACVKRTILNETSKTHISRVRASGKEDPARLRMAFIPIGLRFVEETSGQEHREREDRERSPRSPTNHDHGDATPAADAHGRPDNGHPKESIIETFSRRWRNADEEFCSDKICTRVWEEHEFLGNLGDGQFARTYKVRQKSTGKVLALKLCSMRRLGRGFAIPYEKASLDHEHEARPAHLGLEEEIAWKVRELRLERTLLRCMTGLCPFVMEIAMDCGFSCIFDDLEGELGYPMSAGIGSVKQIWDCFDCIVKHKESEQVKNALRELVIFWAAQMAEALRFLHQCNIIYCDFATHNFVMGHDLYIRLIDFGRSFVDAGQELLSSTFKPPRSLDGLNASRKHKKRRRMKKINFCSERVVSKLRSAGILEERHENEPSDKEMVQLEKLYEIFKLGKTLFSLQWPCDRQFYSAFNKILLPRDIQKYLRDNPSPPRAIISGDLLDFVNHLITDHTQHGVGFTNSDDLIRHPVFRDINFDQLQAKRIQCSPCVYSLMGKILNLDVPTLLATQPRSGKEKEYCGTLSEEQKQVFRSNYIE